MSCVSRKRARCLFFPPGALQHLIPGKSFGWVGSILFIGGLIGGFVLLLALVISLAYARSSRARSIDPDLSSRITTGRSSTRVARQPVSVAAPNRARPRKMNSSIRGRGPNSI